MKPLVVIIPGLGWGNIDPANMSTWPLWVQQLYAALIEAADSILGADVDVAVMVGSYADGNLPEKILAKCSATGCQSVVMIGHSDGGSAAVWAQDHIFRKALPLVINELILIDPVEDLLRHGLLAPLHPTIVLNCFRIYQTADPVIHSNDVAFSPPARLVTEIPASAAPINAPEATHTSVVYLPSLQEFIVNQVIKLAGAA